MLLYFSQAQELNSNLCDIASYMFDLPESQIAQNPAERRDGSRLMCLGRERGEIHHRNFSELPSLLRAGDLLVLNDTRVFNARLIGQKIPGGASVEIFCLSPAEEYGSSFWQALVRPGRKLPDGAQVELSDGHVITVAERLDDGLRLVSLPKDISPGELFARCGSLPLPPYIKHTDSEPERYQTVYSDSLKERSVAAPTAGLHFTDELFASLEASGIERCFITLDVGIGTFRPVKVSDVREHHMHSERCEISEAAAELINGAKASGRRVIAVGTTVVRTLESLADSSGRVAHGRADTDIFIRPGYSFKAIDAMVTNFHLPGSTLLMLVSAFAGHSHIMNAYKMAVTEGYRFFSFGDAMLIE